MHDSQKTRKQRLSHEKLIYMYTSAFENGDIETLAALWSIAEQDPSLAHVIFEMHQIYEHEKREETIMQRSTPRKTSEAFDFTAPDKSMLRPTRIKRFVQTSAAVLAIASLLAGFLLLFSTRHSNVPAETGGKSTTITNQAKGIVVAATNDGTVYGWQASTGHELWHYATGQRMGPPAGNAAGLMIKDDIVYYCSNGHAYALHLTDGKALWTKDLGVPGFGGTLQANQPSLLIDQDVLFVNGFANGIGQVYALQRSTGKLLWHIARGTNYLPILTASDGVAYTLADNDNSSPTIIKAVRSTDGEELWHYQAMAVSGLVVDHTLYVVSIPTLTSSTFGTPSKTQYASQVHTVIPSSGGPYGRSLLAFQAKTGALIWSQKIGANAGDPPVAGNNLVLIYDREQFCAYHQSDGSLVWCKPEDSAEGLYLPTYIATNTALYLSQPGTIPLTSPTPTKNGISMTVQGFFDVIVRSLQTGAVQWTRRFNIEGERLLQVASDEKNNILYTSANNTLYAFNSQSGQKLWQKSFPYTRQQPLSIQALAV